MCKVVTKLKAICDPANHTDQKFILLAELVDDRITKLAEEVLKTSTAEEVLKTSTAIVSLTSDMSDLTTSVSKFINFHSVCPVTKNKKQTENLLFLAKNPKLLILAIIGISAIMGVAIDKADPVLTALLKLF